MFTEAPGLGNQLRTSPREALGEKKKAKLLNISKNMEIFKNRDIFPKPLLQAYGVLCSLTYRVSMTTRNKSCEGDCADRQSLGATDRGTLSVAY